MPGSRKKIREHYGIDVSESLVRAITLESSSKILSGEPCQTTGIMIVKLSVIVVFSFLLSACFVGSSVSGIKKNARGWLPIQPGPEMLKMAKFAARDFQPDSVLKVTDAKVQNILGTCYQLSFQMSSGKHWQAELYRDPNGKLTLLELVQR